MKKKNLFKNIEITVKVTLLLRETVLEPVLVLGNVYVSLYALVLVLIKHQSPDYGAQCAALVRNTYIRTEQISDHLSACFNSRLKVE